jgi:hypothetical protein
MEDLIAFLDKEYPDAITAYRQKVQYPFAEIKPGTIMLALREGFCRVSAGQKLKVLENNGKYLLLSHWKNDTQKSALYEYNICDNNAVWSKSVHILTEADIDILDNGTGIEYKAWYVKRFGRIL